MTADAELRLAETTAAYESLLKFLYRTPVGIAKFRLDGTIEMANPVSCALLMPLSGSSGFSDLYKLMSNVLPELPDWVRQFTAPSGQICDQIQIAVPNAPIVLTLSVNKIDDDTFVAVVQDITRAVELENRVRLDQERLQAIVDNIRDCAICMVDPAGYIEAWNRSLNRLSGWTPADVSDKPMNILVPTDNNGQHDYIGLLERAAQHGTAEVEGWEPRKNGTAFWGATSATALPDINGKPRGYVVMLRDITHRKTLEDGLVALASTDPLTGANNRRAGEARLDEAFARWRRYRRAFSVCMIDCDHFKAVNDTWGHDAGDSVLVALVRLCQEQARDTDVTIRWGGEEFLLLLPETSRDEALGVANRLRLAVQAKSIQHGQRTIAITISIGVAESECDDTEAHDAIRRADRALYQAKSAGRNQAVRA